MKIAFFSAQKYERPFFEQSLTGFSNIAISYFEQSLSTHTAVLAKEFDAVCVFVNDSVDKTVITELVK